MPVRFHASREIMMDVDSEDDLNKLLDVKRHCVETGFQAAQLLKKTGQLVTLAEIPCHPEERIC